MPPRKQKHNQNARNLNPKSDVNDDDAMDTRPNRNKNLLSDEEQEDNDIFKGFTVQKNTKPIVLTLPFSVNPSVTIDDFYNILLPACDAILQVHRDEAEKQIKFSHIHRRMAQAISKTPQINIAYDLLCQRIQKFCNDLPHQTSFYFKKAESIGIFWNTIEDKINKIMILFDSLSYKSKSIPDVFSFYCSEAFKSNIEYFKQASQLIIQAYNKYREKKQNPPIDSSIQFLKETGLFNDYFIPLFIDSVINHIEPKINHSFESSPFNEYLETATEISENELDLATVFGNYSLSLQLADKINALIFSSKKDQIYDKCLRPLLRSQEIDGIWTCSKLARSTNAFNSFIREMALLFEEEATSCFDTNSDDNNDEQNQTGDPISKLLRLYKSLTLFCSRACGPQSTRTVRLAFERGFNSKPEMVARLLALSIHQLFTDKNQSEDNDPFDFEIIDQYVGLFRMLSLNDVFETYHTQLLTRRILTMKDEMVGPETFFIERLKRQCGAEYTLRMEELLKDRSISCDLSESFHEENKKVFDEENNKKQQKTKNSSSKSKNNKDNEIDEAIPEDYLSCFRFLVLPSQIAKTWASLKEVQMVPPWPIFLLLSKFADFYKANMKKRKIDWNLQLTTVRLIVDNVPGLKNVKCSGDFAIILMAFNKESRNDRLKRLKFLLKTIKQENKATNKNEKEDKKQKNSKNKNSSNKKKMPTKKSKTRVEEYSSSNDENDDDHNDDTLSSEDDSEEEDESDNNNVNKHKAKANNNESINDNNNSEGENNTNTKEIKREDIQKEIDEIEESLKSPWKGFLTIDQLKKTTKGNEDEIVSRIRILRSKKSNKIVIEEKSPNNQSTIYRINKKCESQDGTLTLPFIFPQLAVMEEERAKTTISSDREKQLDAAIVSVLKAEKSIEKDFLLNKILNRVNFKVTRDYFEARLKKLEMTEYLKIDPSGKVHYLNGI